MNGLLWDLYDKFYVPPRYEELENDIEECHRQLIELLEKPERRLVLQIIDDKDSKAGRLSFDGFAAGFHLAWRLSLEMVYLESDNE